MDPRLISTNVGFGISILFTLVMAVVVLVKGKNRSLGVLFFLMSFSLGIFEASHLLGINITDPVLSRQVLMWNLSNIFICIFVAHWVLFLIGKIRQRLFPLVLIYVGGVALFIFYLLFPDTFLLNSVPKMYLPNYYVPGSLYWLMRVYFVVVATYFIYELWAAYKESSDPIEKNRFRYVFWGVMYAFVVGSLAVFLVYDVEIDPLWSVFLSFYIVPFAYAMLKYELMDLRIIAKRALAYALAVGGVSIIISFLSFSNEWVTESFPGFPAWVIPVLTSMVAVAIALFIWQKIREADVLKYEFITIITHKFRTPLTRIKWSIETLLETAHNQKEAQELENIAYSTRSLVDLTNTLVSLSTTEFSPERYNFQPLSFSSLIKETVEKNGPHARDKKIALVSQIAVEAPVNADKEKIEFVLQTMIDNALNYSKEGGTVTVSLELDGPKAVCKVQDQGAGIAKEHLSFVFSKFFRGANAKELDTEGIGIGLYMSKLIVERHGGKIAASSAGLAQGSTFMFSLPLRT